MLRRATAASLEPKDLRGEVQERQGKGSGVLVSARGLLDDQPGPPYRAPGARRLRRRSDRREARRARGALRAAVTRIGLYDEAREGRGGWEQWVEDDDAVACPSALSGPWPPP